MNIIRCDSESAWLAERRKSIGGSDAPALFNLTSVDLGYASAFRIALEKLGKAPAREATEEMDMGKALEPAIRDMYQRRTGRFVAFPGAYTIFRHANGFMHASLDGISTPTSQHVGIEPVPPNGVLQCKFSNSDPSEWEEGQPLRLAVEVQVQHEMFCAGLSWGAVAILCAHFRVKFITFDVQRNNEFCAKLVERERRFWDDIHAGVLPDPTAAQEDHRLIRQIHPVSSKPPVVLSDPRYAIMFEEYDLAGRQRKDAEERELRAKNGLELAIGDARGAVLANGVQVSLRSTKDGKRVLRREWVKR